MIFFFIQKKTHTQYFVARLTRAGRSRNITYLNLFCCSASWISVPMAVLLSALFDAAFALLLRLLLLLLLLFDRLSISLLLLIGDGTCWWWLCCGCCSWCKLLWLFCWWLLFVTWIKHKNHLQIARKSLYLDI